MMVICPGCRVPYERHGGARSSGFYRTPEENELCIVCREDLDPVTLQPRIPRPVEAEKS